MIYTPKDFQKPNRFDYMAWVWVFAWPTLVGLFFLIREVMK